MNQKHKERNVMFSGHRRSLKSVETEEPNDEIAPSTSDIEPYVNNSDHLQYNEQNNLKYISAIIQGEYKPNNATNKTNNKTIDSIAHEQKAIKFNEGTYKHNTSTSWGLGEIFSMLADLCMFLAGFDTNQDDNGYRFLYNFVTMLNPNYSRNNTLPEKVMNDTRYIETSIDSERVENIGHRSRVLMSFEETENVTSTTYEKDVNESYVVTSKK
ncbi:uncharacterized protein LOC134752627 [Cydia strobilella]|uniref:uncharacterized protein LOC134752627 n=1 Tax=Cydia strobilella TaxID=1100964 RepID=UPI003003E340